MDKVGETTRPDPALDRVEKAIEDFGAGRIVIVIDDEDRENEGDLILAAETATAEAVNFLTRYGRGVLCAPLSEVVADRLELPMMTTRNTALMGTPFTVSVDAAKGTTTGVSAADRALTLRRLADPDARPEDFAIPGHIFPLRAKEGGVLRRAGHTEATVDLARLAGLTEAGVLCEILNEDGTMARLPDLRRFSEEHGLTMISIDDLIRYRRKSETVVERLAETTLPTERCTTSRPRGSAFSSTCGRRGEASVSSTRSAPTSCRRTRVSTRSPQTSVSVSERMSATTASAPRSSSISGSGR
jgi:3,4-dihydroxy 2-butanone 4-phosphate synthase/GTP cyclohydrolase II